MLLQRFFKDRRASVVPLFALTIIPITGLIGASVDYSRASAVRASMQAAADFTALALSRTANSVDKPALQTIATNYFQAVFNRPEAQNLAVTTDYTTTNGSQLVVTGSATVKTVFMGIMGFQELAVAASGTATWGMTRLRVALVLDNTGSMASSGKMTALKTATKNLLTQLKSAASKDGDVYVSIIPFAKDVNAGPGNYDNAVDRLGRVERSPTAPAARPPTAAADPLAKKTAAPGRRPTTIHGTAASPTATRTTM